MESLGRYLGVKRTGFRSLSHQRMRPMSHVSYVFCFLMGLVVYVFLWNYHI